MTMDGDTIMAVIGAVLGTGGLGGAAAYIWKERETFYKAQLARMEAELIAGRAKVDELQDAALAQALATAEAVRAQMDTYQRLARSLEEQNLTLKEALGVKT